MFHMSQKIFDLQKLKMKAYKNIKRLGSTQDLDNFMKLISKYVILFVKNITTFVNLIKRVNAENAVRQSSWDSATNNNDNNCVT